MHRVSVCTPLDTAAVVGRRPLCDKAAVIRAVQSKHSVDYGNSVEQVCNGMSRPCEERSVGTAGLRLGERVAGKVRMT